MASARNRSDRPGRPNRQDRNARTSERGRAERASVVERRARQASSSGPPVILVILGGLVLLGIVGWAFMRGANQGSSAGTMIFAAEKALGDGMSSIDVNRKLKLAEADSDISVEDRQRIKSIRERLKVRDAETALAAHNMLGTDYLDKKLRLYTKKYLEGEPDKPKARVFLERCQLFRERWPEHPEMDWIERQERRFKGFVDLSQPPTYADVAWKAEALTYAKPRDYTQAFEALDAFLGSATAEEKTLGENLRTKMMADRLEYHEDRMLQAEFEFKTNKDEGKAIHWLVHGVIGMGDARMADEAADFLLKMPSVDEYLRGYKSKQPLVFERLNQHAMMSAHIASLGIE